MSRVYESIGAECAEVGMPFRSPSHVPNSRRALETVEVVRALEPAAFDALDASLFTAHFVDGHDIGDPEVLDALVAATGLPASDVRTRVDRGEGSATVAASVSDAHDHGVAATPAWLFGSDGAELVLPGVQPRKLFERVVARLRAQSE